MCCTPHCSLAVALTVPPFFLLPLLARNVLNYLLSITNVTFQTYATASFLAIVPYLVLFVRFDSVLLA
jgi:uncharacterized membrane protein YdjX (TVP38/TMEM64 family)